MTKRSIIIYVVLALLISWVPQIWAIRLWGLDSDKTRAVFVGVMWSPTLLALAFIIKNPLSRKGIRWRLGRVAYLPLGVGVMTAIGLLLIAATNIFGVGTSGWFAFKQSGVDVLGGPWLLGTGFQLWPLYVVNITVTALVYSTFALVATTGEEFAWRGFLQGHLENIIGIRSGILMLAAIWWAWHLPGLLAGYNFPDYPVFGALVLFPLQMAGASLFFGWLTIRANSFWPAALGHGAVNSVQQGLIDNLRLEGSMLVVDLLRTGLILALGIICWFMLSRIHSEQGADPAIS
jgi:uncharacterized protein